MRDGYNSFKGKIMGTNYLKFYIVKEIIKQPKRKEKILFCSSDKEITEIKLREYINILLIMQTQEERKNNVLQLIENRLKHQLPKLELINIQYDKVHCDCCKSDSKKKIEILEKTNKQKLKEHNELVSTKRREIYNSLTNFQKLCLTIKIPKDISFSDYYYEMIEVDNEQLPLNGIYLNIDFDKFDEMENEENENFDEDEYDEEFEEDEECEETE